MADDLNEPIEEIVQANKKAPVLRRMKKHCDSIVLDSKGTSISTLNFVKTGN